MSNDTVLASATALPNSSRRLFLAAGSAAAVFATVKRAAGAGPVDPIFAAIERHRQAWRAFDEACARTDDVQARNEGREVTEADEAAHEAANDAEMEAFEALVTLPPVTVAGMRAAIEYAIAFELGGIPGADEKFLSALLQSPLLAA